MSFKSRWILVRASQSRYTFGNILLQKFLCLKFSKRDINNHLHKCSKFPFFMATVTIISIVLPLLLPNFRKHFALKMDRTLDVYISKCTDLLNTVFSISSNSIIEHNHIPLLNIWWILLKIVLKRLRLRPIFFQVFTNMSTCRGQYVWKKHL